ncbi:putative two-component sensor kinase [Salmonella enterica subsp. enterica]|nr:putative two-component sensor kinase [Salmonella enterica subsp. enterica] [Salmonella enterica subsp. enterica serovar Menston]
MVFLILRCRAFSTDSIRCPVKTDVKAGGLGLAFVSEAARLLNGEVTLCNRPEGGVLASLTLHRHFT